jgi:hypothetical protein
MLEPDRDQIEIFVNAIFRHAQTGFVSLRAFIEGSNDVFRKTSIRVVSNNLKFLCDAVEDDARRAAQHPKPVVFCPPLATFDSDKSATEKDIAEGFTITVECDENPEAARAKLETILGPATTVIRSGGVWSDGNGVTQDKLHLHWRLAKPAREQDDLVKLKRVREICAGLVGADPTSIPICHPIRWPGSWHRKNQPRLTEIVACDPDIEIDLTDALAKLEPLAPTPPPTDNRAPQPGGDWGTLQYRGGQEPARLDRAARDEDVARRYARSHGGADAARDHGYLADAARRALAGPLRRYSACGRVGWQKACGRERSGGTGGGGSGHSRDCAHACTDRWHPTTTAPAGLARRRADTITGRRAETKHADRRHAQGVSGVAAAQ